MREPRVGHFSITGDILDGKLGTGVLRHSFQLASAWDGGIVVMRLCTGEPPGYVYECNVSGYQAHLEQPDSSVTLQQALIFGSTINAQSATPRASTFAERQNPHPKTLGPFPKPWWDSGGTLTKLLIDAS